MGWEAITACGTAVLAGVGVVTAIYIKKQLDDFRRESRIKHLIDLVAQFESEPLAAYRRALGAKRTSQNVLQPLDPDNPPPELHDVMNFFEHMGYLLEGRYIDLEGVSIEFHYWILHIWKDAREVIEKERAEEPIYYEHFVKMVNRLQEYDRPRTGKVTMPTTDDIENFYIEEAHRPKGSPIPRQKRSSRRSTSERSRNRC